METFNTSQKLHDLWNLCALTPVTLGFLCAAAAPEWVRCALGFFALYLGLDLVYIISEPTCVAFAPVIIAHHGLTLTTVILGMLQDFGAQRGDPSLCDVFGDCQDWMALGLVACEVDTLMFTFIRFRELYRSLFWQLAREFVNFCFRLMPHIAVYGFLVVQEVDCSELTPLQCLGQKALWWWFTANVALLCTFDAAVQIRRCFRFVKKKKTDLDTV